ncbi:MAG: hypothetical protein V5783_07245, partial [Pontiella sp.]
MWNCTFKMIRLRGGLGLSGVMLMSLFVQAQMPHEVLLLVNRTSQDSLKVGNTYMDARKIPLRNVVYLDVPESVYGGSATISPDDFTKRIWAPAMDVVKARGLDDQILAWVYSVDFPIRVKTDSYDRKQMSVSGLTFLRNQIPELSLVEEGNYLSKLFAGPNEQLKLNLNAMSLGIQKKGLGAGVTVPPEVAWLKDGLRDRMPLPSMMLGYTGENGTDVDTVLKSIALGVRSDFRGRRGGIYFVQTDDVRSKCREWQFASAVSELKYRQTSAVVTTNFPAGQRNVMGILMGTDQVDPSQIKSFAPGAMAEHLTSWSAEFQRPQTKCTDWIKAGATASAGIVVEPLSNPNKFPSARFFVHYASGCTMLESFYQSIACPLQNLLIGDPLAKPYAPPFSVKVLGADLLESDFTYLVIAESRLKKVQYEYAFFIDGKEVKAFSDENTVFITLDTLSDGYHELTAVACIQHTVEFNQSVVKPFTVKKYGRSISILPQISRIGKYEHGIKVRIGGAEMPIKIKLVRGDLVLDEKVYDA